MPGRVLLSHSATYTARVSCGDNPTARARPMPYIRPRAPPERVAAQFSPQTFYHWQESSTTMVYSIHTQNRWLDAMLLFFSFFLHLFSFDTSRYVDPSIWAVCIGLSLNNFYKHRLLESLKRDEPPKLKFDDTTMYPCCRNHGSLSCVEDSSAIILRGFSFSLEEYS